MTDTAAQIRARMQTLEQELALIKPHSWNHQRIGDRRRGLELLQMQLDRIERMHKRFLDYRAELVARHRDFVRNGGR